MSKGRNYKHVHAMNDTYYDFSDIFAAAGNLKEVPLLRYIGKILEQITKKDLIAYLTIVTLVLTIMCIILKRKRSYWKRKKIPAPENPNLFFGNEKNLIVDNQAFCDFQMDIYRELEPHAIAGYYGLQNNTLMVRDPDMIKLVLTRDFVHFRNHGPGFEVDDKEPLTKHLFNLTDDTWKLMRNKISPTFTSGKMRIMFGLVKDECDVLLKVLEETLGDIDMKDLTSRYAMDVISSCAFGLKANVLTDPNSMFRRMGLQIITPTTLLRLGSILGSISPKLRRLFGLPIQDQEAANFMKSLVINTVNLRKSSGVKRGDFLDLLMELQNNSELAEEDFELTTDMMAAQCFLFFIAGFDTSSSAMSFALLELALHPEIQDTLRDEIRSSINENGGLTYDGIHKMKYLDKVLNETQRMYPALPVLLRECTKEYRFPNTDIVVEKGTPVLIPVLGIHYDEKYYDNPEEFDPERFSEEAKRSRHPFVFLPFGEGPRMCIGNRFGLMQVKLALAALLNKFKFSVSPEMELPVSYMPGTIFTQVIGGIWLRHEKIN